MSFYYLEQKTNNNTNFFDNYDFNNNTLNIENFESMPPIDMQNTDSNYQCSDNVQITGNAIGSSFANSTLNDCKMKCKSDNSCIGFDFDNSSSSCTLRNTVTDLTSTKQNNVMCIKKNSSACKVSPQTDPQQAAQMIIGENEQMPLLSGAFAPSTIPGVPTPPLPAPTGSNSGGSSGSNYVPSSTRPIPTPSSSGSMNKSGCKPDTIFVDLACFLNKMDVLKNHSDNLMVDLQLVITNLKGCSYVRKPQKQQQTTNPFKPISGGDSFDNWNINDIISTNGESNGANGSSIVMPTPDTIKVYNSPASVLYTNNPLTNTNVMLGITEPFEDSESSGKKMSFFNTFTFKIIVIVIILVFLMNMK